MRNLKDSAFNLYDMRIILFSYMKMLKNLPSRNINCYFTSINTCVLKKIALHLVRELHDYLYIKPVYLYFAYILYFRII